MTSTPADERRRARTPNMASMISRKYRKQIAKERLPASGEPLAIVGQEGSRHHYHGRLPSAGTTRPKTASLRVVDLNNETVKQLAEISTELKHFDMSRLHLVKITEEVLANMDNLQRLNLSNNELTEEGLPKYKIQRMKMLEEFDISYNLLASLPATFLKLSSITRLNLSHNKLTSVDGIDKLRTLKSLILENNCLERLPNNFYKGLKKLEVLILANNKLKSLPQDVKFLTKLHHLDFSGNMLVTVPPVVFFVPFLEVVDLSHNRLTRIPTLNINKTRVQKITILDLSHNLIRIFPDFLMKFVVKLDLSYNKIKSVTYKLLRQLDMDKGGVEQELNLEGNQVKTIPQDVCDGGLRSIVHTLIEMQMKEVIYHGMKVLVVGGQASGKTSLIQSLVDEQSCLTEEGQESYGIDIYDHVIKIPGTEDEDDKNLSLTFWDFAGHPSYLHHNAAYLQDKSLLLIAFNLTEFTRASFQSQIAFWFKWILAKHNHVTALLVGTFKDEVEPKREAKIKQIVKEEVEKFFTKRKQAIDDERKSMEHVPYLTPGMREYLLKHCNNILHFKHYVHPNVVTLSSKSYEGFEDLAKEIQAIAESDDVFPEVLTVVPSLFKEAELLIESSRYEFKMPILTKDKFQEVVTKKFGLKRVIDQVGEYMHLCGKIYWARDNPQIAEVLFIYPTWLAEVTGSLFRHDFDKMDYVIEEHFKDAGVTEDKFNTLRSEIVTQGVIDMDFLRGSWMNFVPEDHKHMKEMTNIICDKFEYFYFLNPKYKDHDVFGQLVPRHESGALLRSMSDFSSPLDPTKSTENVRLKPVVSQKQSKPASNQPAGSVPRMTEVEEESQAPFERAGSVAGSATHPRSAERHPHKFQIMSLMPDEPPTRYHELVKALDPCLGSTLTFTFPDFYPPGLIQSLAIRLIHYGFVPVATWRTGMLGSHRQRPLAVTLLLSEDKKGRPCLRVEGKVAAKPGEDLTTEETGVLFWACMLPVLKIIDQQLNSMPGLWVKRSVMCPSCGESGFIGEWNTPKELQEQDEATCDACKQSVPTTFLIQPKEKKKIDEFLLRKLRDRREAADSKSVAPEAARPVSANTRLPREVEPPDSPRTQTAKLFVSQSYASYEDIKHMHRQATDLAREVYSVHAAKGRYRPVSARAPPPTGMTRPRTRPVTGRTPRLQKRYTQFQLMAMDMHAVNRVETATPIIEPFV